MFTMMRKKANLLLGVACLSFVSSHALARSTTIVCSCYRHEGARDVFVAPVADGCFGEGCDCEKASDIAAYTCMNTYGGYCLNYLRCVNGEDARVNYDVLTDDGTTPDASASDQSNEMD